MSVSDLTTDLSVQLSWQLASNQQQHFLSNLEFAKLQVKAPQQTFPVRYLLLTEVYRMAGALFYSYRDYRTGF